MGAEVKKLDTPFRNDSSSTCLLLMCLSFLLSTSDFFFSPFSSLYISTQHLLSTPTHSNIYCSSVLHQERNTITNSSVCPPLYFSKQVTFHQRLFHVNQNYLMLQRKWLSQWQKQITNRQYKIPYSSAVFWKTVVNFVQLLSSYF